MEQQSFNYTLSHKNKMLVVSFVGEMGPAVLPGLDACRQEILAKEDLQCVVLYFRGVGKVSADAITMLAQIQREIRSRGLELRLCSLPENLRERLIRMGVIRGLEVADDLKTALMSFSRVA